MLGNRERVYVTYDAQRDASVIERRNVYRVVPHAVARDDLEPRGLANSRSRQRLGTDYQGIGFADERSVALLGYFLDVIIGRTFNAVQQRQPCGMPLSCDQQVRHQ